MTKKVFVTGAGGFVGRSLIPLLVERGYSVSAWSHRDPSGMSSKNDERITQYWGDLSEPSPELSSRMEKAMEGSSAVVHLAARTSQGPSTRALSETVNVGATSLLIDSYGKSGSGKFVFVSSQSAKISNPGAYGASKRKAEELLRNSKADYVILRPAIIYGKGSAGIFKKFVDLLEKFPVIPLPSAPVKFRPVFVDDVSWAIIKSIESQKASRQTYDVAGPDPVTFPELIRLVSEALHLKRVILPVPMGLAIIGAGLLTKVMKNPPVTVDNLIGLSEETPVDLRPLKEDLNMDPLPLREGLRLVFGQN